MKRFLAAVMVLLSVVTLSGCKEVPGFLPSYWDGLTKRGAEEYIQSALQEKYGEEFVVKRLMKRSGQYYTEMLAYCSPKSDENIVFEIEVNHSGKNRNLYDGYIQSLVRQEMKCNIDSVLAKHFDKFAAEVDVRGLSDSYDSGIYVAEEATIKNYSEALPDTNKTHIWIVLNENEVDLQEKINSVTEEMTANFYSTYAYIDFYYATDNTIDQCIEKINSTADRLDVYVILSGKFPYDTFVFDGNDKEDKLTQVEFADKKTKFNGS